VGPIARTVEDAAIVLNAIAGPDAKDPSSSSRPCPDYQKDMMGDIRGLRVGIPLHFFRDHVDPEIGQAVDAAIRKLEALGMKAVEVDIPGLENCAAMEAHINLAEAFSYHEQYLKKQADAYGPGVRTDLEAGRFLLASDYVKSQRARAWLQRNFNEAFERADVVVSPTVPAFPPKVGQVWVQSGDRREHITDAFLRFNIPYDLTGFPAISVPCGFSSAGLPIGLQIGGRAFEETTILKIAHAYEQSTDWHLARPTVH
jgi:aspartyl-tRNA(Asn)/glutamyl-tRNA(Gln) amidotransferase subunit A